MSGCCARCGVAGRDAGGAAELRRVSAGRGSARVPGTRGPAGWRVVGTERAVWFERFEAVCPRCLGDAVPAMPDAAPQGMRDAAGFGKRYRPETR